MALRSQYPSQSTCWTVLRRAHSSQQGEQEEAWQVLVATYRNPVIAYFRGRGASPTAAADLAQDFFSDLYSGRHLAQLTPNHGRFRTWLYTCLERRSIDLYRHEKCVEAYRHEEAITAPPGNEAESPERAFERSWALVLIDRAVRDLERRYSGSPRRRELFRGLLAHLQGQLEDETLAELAARLDMSAGSVRNAHGLLREQLGACLRATVAETVDSEGEIEAELRHLLTVFAS
jgi:RNA polymerase sigma factor (sigma-70 family)